MLKLVFAEKRFAVQPKIDRSTFRSLTVKVGQMVKLDVKVTGEPAPKKTWFKDKVQIGEKQTDGVRL